MAEQYRTEQTSEEISRWDAASYPGGINRYAEELRDAIERELREWGECPLLERLDRERPHISVPLFEVLQSVRRRQKNGAAPAASGNRSFAEILQQKYGFDPKSWIRSFYKYSSVEQLVDELRAAGHRAMDRTEHRSVPVTEKEGTGDTSVPVSVAGQPSPAEESRRTPAVREAREEREPSPAGPAPQTASSGKEAGALLAEARREAAEITGDARRRAEEILEGAKREAAALLEDARQKRERSRAEAEAFREQTMERARLDARQETGRLTQRYLTEAQRRERIGTARPTPEEDARIVLFGSLAGFYPVEHRARLQFSFDPFLPDERFVNGGYADPPQSLEEKGRELLRQNDTFGHEVTLWVLRDGEEAPIELRLAAVEQFREALLTLTYTDPFFAAPEDALTLTVDGERRELALPYSAGESGDLLEAGVRAENGRGILCLRRTRFPDQVFELPIC